MFHSPPQMLLLPPSTPTPAITSIFTSFFTWISLTSNHLYVWVASLPKACFTVYAAIHCSVQPCAIASEVTNVCTITSFFSLSLFLPSIIQILAHKLLCFFSLYFIPLASFRCFFIQFFSLRQQRFVYVQMHAGGSSRKGGSHERKKNNNER
ncbi:hypothetical protein BJV74DRAFT_416186 [Russula compacta]|nr:hypothetical protein BJV74DRAFT_416186 [Russula compacta]